MDLSRLIEIGRYYLTMRRLIIFGVGSIILSGCSMRIEKRHDTQNYNSRISGVIIHYTAESLSDTEQRFKNKNVSAHYAINNNEIIEFVPPNKRAWHAGKSHWEDRSALNDSYIGIEMVNLANCTESLDDSMLITHCTYPPYSKESISSLIYLLNYLKNKGFYYNPSHVTSYMLGHQDISSDRKLDPGPIFPWKQLYNAGYGAWYEEQDFTTLLSYMNESDVQFTDDDLYHILTLYGYSGKYKTHDVILAFQTHFVQDDITSVYNNNTMAAALALMYKYKPDQLVLAAKSNIKLQKIIQILF